MDDWDTLPNGNLAIYPVVGWDSAIGQMIGLLRLRYARSESEFESGGVPVQIHLTPVQLRMLSQDLSNMADRIDAQNLGTRQ
ncbi:hypothetical protein [Sphingomonas sp. VDB2]|uniref:hypothetical protein n=1 Tax=Sphingomonas sp. VDB2 TaxID=3228751 RepID=UPI003A8132C5